jgi:hypothetical protein
MTPATATDPAAPPKPIAGIATVLVLCGYAVLRVLIPRPVQSTNPDVLDFRAVANGITLFGNSVAIIGALMAMMGQRAGNRVVRLASAAMIPLTLVMVAMAWAIMRDIPDADTTERRGALVALTGVAALFALAPWLLFLFLFRRSKYG